MSTSLEPTSRIEAELGFPSEQPVTRSGIIAALSRDSAKISRGVMLAVRSLWLHKLRAFLSVLGIIIGTSAVIALMAFGEGSMQDALEDIRRQGATNVIVRSVKPDGSSEAGQGSRLAMYGLTMRDHDSFKMILGDALVRQVPMRIFNYDVRFEERKHQCRVIGTNSEYQDVNKLELSAGRFLSPTDTENMKPYAVLGSGTAERLFPFTNPLGKTVTIKELGFEVVGVVKERMPTGGSGGSQAAEDFNNDLYVPLETLNRYMGEKIYIRTSGSSSWEQVELNQITCTVSEIEHVRPAGDRIREHLERNHKQSDWLVTVPLDRLEEAERAKDRFTRLLVLIASISLVVGGIGIMNIMLATVTERTREIGIRRALGAKRRDITMQFLIEAVVQTSVGGLAGVLLGLGMVFFIPVLWEMVTDSSLPAVVHVPAIFLALGVSIGVGVLFGWFPARQAARLDPIEALRHD